MKRLVLGFIAIAAVIITGCGGEAELLNAPEITMVMMGTDNVAIVWTPDSTVANSADFQGYYVFVSNDSTALLVDAATAEDSLSPVNTAAITDTTYTITGLVDSLIYYIQVRTVNTGDKVGAYNTTKPQVKASPRPEFTVTVTLELAPGNQNEPNCGLIFATGALTNETNDEFPNADVFFERFIQAGAETLQVNSASRRANGRTTLMHSYGQMAWDDLSEVDPADLVDDHAPFVVEDLIALVTEEENYVKLHIDAYDSLNATVDVTFAYQDNAGLPFFAVKK